MSFKYDYDAKEKKIDMSDPRQVIIDHYEWLKNEVETSAYICQTDDFLSEDKCVFRINAIEHPRDVFAEFSGDKEAFGDPYNEAAEYNKTNLFSELDPKSIKEIDYIVSMTENMVYELDKCCDETLIHFESIKKELDTSKISEDEFMRKIFGNKHCFILDVDHVTSGYSCSPFNFYLFVLDFYLDRETQDKLA